MIRMSNPAMILHHLRYMPRFIALAAAAVLAACAGRESAPARDTARADASRACDVAGAREVVERFGERLRDVSLLAPDSDVTSQIREAYAPFVTASLVDAWIARPDSAPGRRVSSPWPERIEIDSVTPAEPGACRVAGEVVYVTSVEETQGGAAARERVVLRVASDSGWRISDYGVAEPRASADTSGPKAAVDVVRRYYRAVNARDYRAAYALWGDAGAASKQGFEGFAAGLGNTAGVTVDVGTPGPIEGAAGSRYVMVPVVIRARMQNGERQRFEGTYTLRRSVVDGASPEQRRWHIYSAAVRRVRQEQ